MDIWDKMCNDMISQIRTSKDGMIHTVNGKYLQIRTKDSKPYHPVVSAEYGVISNKGRAVFHKKDYLNHLQSVA